MTEYQLADYGWIPELELGVDDGAYLGRVLRVDRGSSLVVTRLGTDRCYPRGSSDLLPVTGDWVSVTPEPGLGYLLVDVLERTSTLKRLDPSEDFEQVLVANVDTMFVLQGLDRPSRVGRLERLCLITRDAGATPVVVITKTDLEDSGDAVIGTMEAIEEVHRVVRGVDIIPVSSATGSGVHLLSPYLERGQTVGLLGESGAGKSTLVNRLAGVEVQATSETRPGDSKGRHTTTSRELIPLPSGAVLVDTPGLRSIAMLGDRTGLTESYSDVEALFDGCRFRDCGHDTEPGCAVTHALATGELEQSRWLGYRKLLREIASQERRAGDRTRQAEFKEWNRKLAKFRRDLDR